MFTEMELLDMQEQLNIANGENAEMKADLKKVKEIFTQMAAMFGMINEDGTINQNLSIKKIMGEVSSIITGAMMPNLNPFAKKVDIAEKFSFLKEIMPIYEKYKSL